jgi:DNA mismatch endonuclease, patch repair protein
MMDDNPSDLRKPAPSEVIGVSRYATSAGRSRNMASIRRTDTAPERRVRSELHRRGYRFRKDFRIKLGTTNPRPDIVFTRWKVAVFIDGCFWHVCPEHAAAPKQNKTYWGPKLAGNVLRDRRHDAALVDAGWAVVRAWEHEDAALAADRIEATLIGRQTVT